MWMDEPSHPSYFTRLPLVCVINTLTLHLVLIQALALRPADNTVKLGDQLRWIPSRLKYTLLSAKRKGFWRR